MPRPALPVSSFTLSDWNSFSFRSVFGRGLRSTASCSTGKQQDLSDPLTRAAMLRLSALRLARRLPLSPTMAAARRNLSAETGATVDVPAPGSGGVVSAKVAALVDEVVSLNMLEVKQLTDSLKDRLGIEDTGGMPAMNPAMMAMMAGGAPGNGAAAAAEPVAEKTAFDLKLEKFDPSKKIAVIKEIRSITGLGLKEAKAMVEGAPKVFKNDVAKAEAEQIRDKLKEIGGEVVLE